MDLLVLQIIPNLIKNSIAKSPLSLIIPAIVSESIIAILTISSRDFSFNSSFSTLLKIFVICPNCKFFSFLLSSLEILLYISSISIELSVCNFHNCFTSSLFLFVKSIHSYLLILQSSILFFFIVSNKISLRVVTINFLLFFLLTSFTNSRNFDKILFLFIETSTLPNGSSNISNLFCIFLSLIPKEKIFSIFESIIIS